MQEVFEKIIEKLEGQIRIEENIAKKESDGHPITHQYAANCMKVIEKSVKQEAEQFCTDTNVGSNGWIPCSERLPEESLNDVIGWDAYRERCCFVHYIGGRFILGDDTESVKITHWMPTPYQPKGE